jgi:hypothetical protein
MRCGNSSLLNTLIELYPKVLYSIRAFTHALAYFNSCLNPYLYAILNRNFCIDLVDIIPSWRICCNQPQILENEHSTRYVKSSTNQIILTNKYQNHAEDEEDELDYHEQKQTTNDVSCQVELLGIKSKDISSLHHQTN